MNNEIDYLDYCFKSFNTTEYLQTLTSGNFGSFGALTEIFEQFKYNIRTAITNSRIPYTVAIYNSFNRQWNLIAIESGFTVDERDKIDDLFNKDMSENPQKYSESHKDELLKVCEGICSVNNNDQRFVCDINLQFAVQLWSSIEVFLKGWSIHILNGYTSNNPVKTLLDNQHFKKRLDKRISFDELKKHNFRIDDKLGTILLSEMDFSNFSVIDNLIESVFMKSYDLPFMKTIYEINKSRHVVVHRRGVIDNEFKDSTTTEQNVGDYLKINEEKIKVYLVAIRELSRFITSDDVINEYFGREI